jgi:hypothetical protein
MSIKVNLVNYEMTFNNGILTKFANKMKEHLDLLGVETTISPIPDTSADINHHINYLPYKPNSTLNTLMITHIFDGYKLDRVRENMETADIGICMSDDTRDWLIEKGLDKDKLKVILPAHDQLPRRKKKVLIVTNVYPDGCKREEMFYSIPRNDEFEFTIMGKGWKQAQYPEFNLEIYKEILPKHDYLLYFGKDEGAMSVVDAKQVGLAVIAPLTGFHKELDIDYPFDTQDDLNGIFKRLAHNPVSEWTWANYALNHKTLWENIVSSTKKK